MKTCIWCLKKEGVTFEKVSHILPQNLGSKKICRDVCDTCNQYFGEKTGRFDPSIDIALKEMLVLSKYQKIGSILSVQNEIGKENAKSIFGQSIGNNVIQTLNRNTEFFKIEERNGKMGFNTTEIFKYHSENPNILTNRLKRGLFKVAFETAHNEEIFKERYINFYNPFFHYIRDFVRWDKGNLKLFYLQRKVGAEIITIDIAANPRVMLHMIKDNYLKIEILGHVFAFSIGKSNLTEHLFLQEYIKPKSLFHPIDLKSFLNMDIFNQIYKN